MVSARGVELLESQAVRGVLRILPIPLLRCIVRPQVVEAGVPHRYSAHDLDVLGIDRSEFRTATHQDTVGADGHESGSTLGLAGNDDLQIARRRISGGCVPKDLHHEFGRVDFAAR